MARADDHWSGEEDLARRGNGIDGPACHRRAVGDDVEAARDRSRDDGRQGDSGEPSHVIEYQAEPASTEDPLRAGPGRRLPPLVPDRAGSRAAGAFPGEGRRGRVEHGPGGVRPRRQRGPTLQPRLVRREDARFERRAS